MNNESLDPALAEDAVNWTDEKRLRMAKIFRRWAEQLERSVEPPKRKKKPGSDFWKGFKRN